jgi:hypothetical protein
MKMCPFWNTASFGVKLWTLFYRNLRVLCELKTHVNRNTALFVKFGIFNPLQFTKECSNPNLVRNLHCYPHSNWNTSLSSNFCQCNAMSYLCISPLSEYKPVSGGKYIVSIAMSLEPGHGRHIWRMSEWMNQWTNKPQSTLPHPHYHHCTWNRSHEMEGKHFEANWQVFNIFLAV